MRSIGTILTTISTRKVSQVALSEKGLETDREIGYEYTGALQFEERRRRTAKPG